MKLKIHISMDAKVVEMVKDSAETENRTFSNMVEALVRRALFAAREDQAKGGKL